MDLVLMGAFDRYSGYGNDTIDLAVNLDRAGIRVTPLPTSILPGLPRSFTRLLERDPTGRKDVVLNFGAPFDLKPWDLDGLARKTVGYTMWERTPMVVTDFEGHGWEPHDLSFKGLDALVVTCPMNVEALAPFTPDDVPTYVVPCGIEPDDWPQATRDGGPARFLMTGMLGGGRKNVFAVLETWQQIRREVPEFDATLHVHCLGPGLHPAAAEAYGPGITMSSRPLERDALVAMYHAHDVMLCPSRGEGNNKPPMEFMATGGAVAATDWSGHQNWLHPDLSLPLAGTLVPVADGSPVQHFEVDREHLRRTILECWMHPNRVRRMGQQAAPYIRQSMSWDAVIPKMVRVLESL